jgi:L-fuculose-phosphate aldolase
MTMTEQESRQQLLDTSRNVSVRYGDGMLITPSAVPVSEMTPESMMYLDMVSSVEHEGTPSSEWHFHRDILAVRPEIGAVIHTHSTFATTIACLGKDVPPVHYMIAMAGGDSIRCTPYTVFGGQGLSDRALEALRDRKACLLGNHGLIALGTDLADALAVVVEVEFICEVYWRTLQAGAPNILTAQQMHEVNQKFGDYKKRS